MIPLNDNIEKIKNGLGSNSNIIVKKICIGKDKPVQGAVIYIDELADKSIIDRDILNPIMLHINENISSKDHIADFLSQKYIPMSDTTIETDINKVIDAVKRGKTSIVIDNSRDFIVLDTSGGEHRSIEDPQYETSIRGAREGFVESIDTNISILRRRIKDKNLVIERLVVGRRSQTDIAILYLDDVVNRNVLNSVRDRISKIDVDGIEGGGVLTQYIEKSSYSIFPEIFRTERSDVAEANILEGRVIIIIDGSPHIKVAPTSIFQFLQAIEDYNQRTIISSFSRILRVLAAVIVITFPSIYLTLINFNVELIPTNFVTPVASARKGIALSPFLEIISMQITIEFLREGGLWLPGKIAQTLSIVGGIIIGQMAIESKFVSPTTLFVVGFTTIATFLIPKYDMSLIIRLLGIAMLIITKFLGTLGIAAFSFFLLSYLSSFESFGEPYFEFKLSNMKDIFIRAPLWKMNQRPTETTKTNPTRETDFRKNFNDDDDKK